MENDKQVQVKAFTVKPSLKETKKLVTELMAFIDENKLSVNIAGKRYLEVEAWQFAGSQLGLSAIVTNIEDVSTDVTPRYKATVEVIHTPTGQLVSRGFALCSRAETKKKGFDEYAVMSMAQTRAIGKAYRNILAWLVKMAGFEGTPAAEVSENLREDMSAELTKAKQDVYKVLKAKGMTSVQMVQAINNAIGKDVVETVDDAFKVIEFVGQDSESQES